MCIRTANRAVGNAGRCDWKVMAGKAGFVYIKASEADSPDRNFKANWQDAMDAGIPRGAYHFYHPTVYERG